MKVRLMTVCLSFCIAVECFSSLLMVIVKKFFISKALIIKFHSYRSVSTDNPVIRIQYQCCKIKNAIVPLYAVNDLYHDTTVCTWYVLHIFQIFSLYIFTFHNLYEMETFSELYWIAPEQYKCIISKLFRSASPHHFEKLYFRRLTAILYIHLAGIFIQSTLQMRVDTL